MSIPGDKGIFCLSFDNMGNAYDVGLKQMATQDPLDPSLVTGYPRLLALLERRKLRASFFVEGWNAIHNSDLVKSVVAQGHEVGLHGWVHEVYHKLDAIDAERVMADSLSAFRAIGVEPQGFRAPGGERGPFTTSILAKYGIAFDSSVDQEAAITEPVKLENGIPSLPWLWQLIDFYQYGMHPQGPQSPARYEALLSAEMERVATQGGVFTPIFHAVVSCVEDEKFAVLERLLDKAQADDRLQIMTAQELAHRFGAAQATCGPQ